MMKVGTRDVKYLGRNLGMQSASTLLDAPSTASKPKRSEGALACELCQAAC